MTKPTPQPISETKTPFVQSLDNVLQQSTNLLYAVETLIETGGVKGKVAEGLKKHCQSLKAALTGQ